MADLKPINPEFAYNPDVTPETAVNVGGPTPLADVDTALAPGENQWVVHQGTADDAVDDANLGNQQYLQADAQSPTFLETLGASWRLENSLGSMGAAADFQKNWFDDQYNVMLDPRFQESSPEDQRKLFASGNTEFTEELMAGIEREREDRRISEMAGGMSMATDMAVSIVEPWNVALIATPFAMGLRGASIARSAMLTAAEGAVSTTATEMTLHSSQQLRTMEESQMNVLMGTLVSGGLGAAVGAFTKSGFKAATKEANQLITAKKLDTETAPLSKEARSAGAREVETGQQVSDDISDYDLVMSGNKFGETVLKTAMSPEVTLSMSQSITARQAGVHFADTTLLHKGQLKGKMLVPDKGSIESRVNVAVGSAWEANNVTEEAFFKYRQVDASSKIQRAKLAVSDKFSPTADTYDFEQFKEEVFWAIDSGNAHDVPEVNAAVKAQQQFYDDWKNKSHESGLISDELVESDSTKYLHRMWKHDQITAKRDQVRQKFASWFQTKQFDSKKNLEGQKDPDQAALLDAEIAAMKFGETAKYLQATGKDAVTEQAKVRSQLNRNDPIQMAKLEALEYKQRVAQGTEINDPDMIELDVKIQQQLEADKVRYEKEFDSKRTNKEATPESKEAFVNEKLGSSKASKKLRKDRDKAEVDLTNAFRFATMTRDDFVGISDQIIDNILGTGVNRTNVNLMPEGMVHKAGAFKSRSFDIPNAMVKDMGIVETDVGAISKAYVRTTSPQVEIAGDFGDIDAKDLFDNIKADHDELRNVAIQDLDKSKANEKTRQKKMNQLAADEKKDMKAAQVMRDRLLGTYKQSADPTSMGSRTIKTLKELNFLSKLGGMALSSIPDMARPVMTYGFRDSMKMMQAIAKHPAQTKMAHWEAKRAAAGIELFTNGRMQKWGDLTDDIMGATKFERGVSKMADSYGKITGMNYWNDFMKTYSGTMVQDSILRHSQPLLDGGELSKAGNLALGRAGINPAMAKRIAQQFKKHGDDTTDLKVANTPEWDDPDVVAAYRSAINQMTNKMIVTPGIGEMPAFVGGETMGLVLQFKSFIMSSHSRVFLSTLQQRDQAALSGVLMAGFLGSATYGLKQWTAGNEISDNPSDFIMESLDRGGVLGYTMEVENILAKITGGSLSVKKALGGESSQYSRYASRNMTAALLGPSIGYSQDFISVIRGMSTNELSEGDISSLRRMTPMQNLFYIRWLFDEIQDKATDAFVE